MPCKKTDCQCYKCGLISEHKLPKEHTVHDPIQFHGDDDHPKVEEEIKASEDDDTIIHPPEPPIPTKKYSLLSEKLSNEDYIHDEAEPGQALEKQDSFSYGNDQDKYEARNLDQDSDTSNEEFIRNDQNEPSTSAQQPHEPSDDEIAAAITSPEEDQPRGSSRRDSKLLYTKSSLEDADKRMVPHTSEEPERISSDTHQKHSTKSSKLHKLLVSPQKSPEDVSPKRLSDVGSPQKLTDVVSPMRFSDKKPEIKKIREEKPEIKKIREEKPKVKPKHVKPIYVNQSTSIGSTEKKMYLKKHKPDILKSGSSVAHEQIIKEEKVGPTPIPSHMNDSASFLDEVGRRLKSYASPNFADDEASSAEQAVASHHMTTKKTPVTKVDIGLQNSSEFEQQGRKHEKKSKEGQKPTRKKEPEVRLQIEVTPKVKPKIAPDAVKVKQQSKMKAEPSSRLYDVVSDGRAEANKKNVKDMDDYKKALHNIIDTTDKLLNGIDEANRNKYRENDKGPAKSKSGQNQPQVFYLSTPQLPNMPMEFELPIKVRTNAQGGIEVTSPTFRTLNLPSPLVNGKMRAEVELGLSSIGSNRHLGGSVEAGKIAPSKREPSIKIEYPKMPFMKLTSEAEVQFNPSIRTAATSMYIKSNTGSYIDDKPEKKMKPKKIIESVTPEPPPEEPVKIEESTNEGSSSIKVLEDIEEKSEKISTDKDEDLISNRPKIILDNSTIENLDNSDEDATEDSDHYSPRTSFKTYIEVKELSSGGSAEHYLRVPTNFPQQKDIKVCVQCECKTCPLFDNYGNLICPKQCGCCTCPFFSPDPDPDDRTELELCHCTSQTHFNTLGKPLVNRCNCSTRVDLCPCRDLYGALGDPVAEFAEDNWRSVKMRKSTKRLSKRLTEIKLKSLQTKVDRISHDNRHRRTLDEDPTFDDLRYSSRSRRSDVSDQDSRSSRRNTK